MGDNNIQDALEVGVSAISYAAAITVLIIAVSIYNRNQNFLSQRIDEKQSIETAVDKNIDYRMENAEKDKLSKTEVYNSILAVENPDVTKVIVNSYTISPSTIKSAADGDERSMNAILSTLHNSNYLRTNIYDTGSSGDFLSQIVFLGV